MEHMVSLLQIIWIKKGKVNRTVHNAHMVLLDMIELAWHCDLLPTSPVVSGIQADVPTPQAFATGVASSEDQPRVSG